MPVDALPAGLHRFSLADLPRERWRNGAGWTRAVAQRCDADGGALLWRVSLAEIGQAAPFSRFDGMARTTVLASGGPVQLHSDGRVWDLVQRGDMAAYPGELALANGEPGTEALFWNVMARRGQVSATVQVLRGHDLGAWPLPTQGHSLVWVVHGACALTGGAMPVPAHFGAAQGFGLADTSAGFSLQLRTPDTLLLHTHLV